MIENVLQWKVYMFCDCAMPVNGTGSKRKSAAPRKLTATSDLDFNYADSDEQCLAMDPIAVGNAVRKMMMTSYYDDHLVSRTLP